MWDYIKFHPFPTLGWAFATIWKDSIAQPNNPLLKPYENRLTKFGIGTV